MSRFEQFRFLFEVFGVGLAAAALYFALDANLLAQRTLADQQESGAWQILSSSAAGTAGKSYALGVLLKPGAVLSGLDLSCEGMGSAYDLGRCDRPPDLSGLKLEPAGKFTIRGSNFDGADLNHVVMRGGSWIDTKLSRVDLEGADLTGSWLSVTLSDAYLVRTKFSGSTFAQVDFSSARLFAADFSNSRFFGVQNISSTLFCHRIDGCSTGLPARFFENAWYYEGEPPSGLKELGIELSSIRKCPMRSLEERAIKSIFDDPFGCIDSSEALGIYIADARAAGYDVGVDNVASSR